MDEEIIRYGRAVKACEKNGVEDAGKCATAVMLSEDLKQLQRIIEGNMRKSRII